MTKKPPFYLRPTYIANGVSIITCTHIPDYIDNIFENYNRQAYDLKELIIVLNNNNNLDIKEWEKKAKDYKNVRVFKLTESISPGSCVNFAISQSNYEFIAIFDHDDYYGTRYLNDYIEAARITDAGLFGKKSHYVFLEEDNTLAIMHPGFENCYVDYVDGPTVFCRRSIFNKVQYIDSDFADCQLSFDCTNHGIKIYSVNKYHFAYLRKSNINKHTWKLDNHDIVNLHCQFLGKTTDIRAFVDASEP